MKRTKEWLAAGSAAVAAVLAIGGCGPSDSSDTAPTTAKGLTKVVIAVPGVSAAAAFAEVAVRSGIARQNGLDLTLNSGVKPPDTPAAMVRGSIDGGILLGTATKAHAKGLAVVNVVATASHEPFVLMAAPGITSLNELVGKSIVTSSPTDTPGTQTAALLRMAGLTDKVKVIGLTSTAAESALFISKQADAEYVALNQALKDAEKRPGSAIILDNSRLPAEPAGGITVSQAFLKDHPDVVKALVKSCMQAADMMKNHPDRATPFIEEAYGLSLDEAKQFLRFQGKNIELVGVPKAEYFKNVATAYDKIPDSEVKWTEDLVAQSWDTSIAAEVANELGFN